MPRHGALKGFSDSLAIIEDYWETRLEHVTRQVAKWFSGLGSEKQEARDWEETTNNARPEQCSSEKGSQGCSVMSNGFR